MNFELKHSKSIIVKLFIEIFSKVKRTLIDRASAVKTEIVNYLFIWILEKL